MTVLLACATRYGSTREVADVVARVLRESGLAVLLQPACEVTALDRHSAVVLGAPLYLGRWLADARDFLREHRARLAALPLAAFALGPLGPGEMEWDAARRQLETELRSREPLQLVASAVFGGRYDPARLDARDALLAGVPGSPLHGRPSSDRRDWDAIDAWARELAAALR